MSRHGRTWTRDETLLAFEVYCRLPFGRLHRGNADIIELSEFLGRTPSSVAMKACNFASLDPAQRERGISGLKNAGRHEKDIWTAFFEDSAAVVQEIDDATRRIGQVGPDDSPLRPPTGPSEGSRTATFRRHQTFFRTAVLSTYEHRCALTGLQTPSLLVASHIIPWKSAESRRCDPTNGLCLNALHDRAFDRGLITFDDDMRLVVSTRLGGRDELGLLDQSLRLEGTSLQLPRRFRPDPVALAFHREHVFQS